MENEASFADLMTELRAGDATAAERIFRAYARRLVGLARSRLNQHLRAKTDPEDIVQSVFRSFFGRQAQGQFEVQGWNDLWSLLAVITLRKCGHKAEHFRAACRDVSREAAPPSTDDSVASFALIAREPAPAEAAIMIEILEHVTAALDPRDRRVLELRMQGASMAEISSELDCTERTAERALERIRRKLEKAIES